MSSTRLRSRFSHVFLQYSDPLLIFLTGASQLLSACRLSDSPHTKPLWELGSNLSSCLLRVSHVLIEKNCFPWSEQPILLLRTTEGKCPEATCHPLNASSHVTVIFPSSLIVFVPRLGTTRAHLFQSQTTGASYRLLGDGVGGGGGGGREGAQMV